MTNKNMLGVKLFKENDDESFSVIRIVKIYSDPDKVMIEDDKEVQTKTTLTALSKDGYTILESKGIIMFSIVTVGKLKDVVVALVKKIDMAMGNNAPCVICRQSCTDFFYNLLANTEGHDYVGVSVSEKTCPTNIEFGDLLLCDTIDYSNVVNIYLDDDIDSVLRCVNVSKFDAVLSDLYDKHVKAADKPMLAFKKQDKGWCKNLRTLLSINNFYVDIDSEFNITDLDFKVEDNLIIKKDKNDKEYRSFTNDAMRFLSSIWFSESDTRRMNISNTIVEEYGYDIDLGEYRNENYVLIKDSENKLYVVVYTVDGEYLETDIAKEREELSRVFALKIVDKYNSKK